MTESIGCALTTIAPRNGDPMANSNARLRPTIMGNPETSRRGSSVTTQRDYFGVHYQCQAGQRQRPHVEAGELV